MKPLSWTTLNLEKFREALHQNFGVDVSNMTVSARLDSLGYSRQTNQKMLQAGKESPNRDKQFNQINETNQEFLNAGDPVISVDTKRRKILEISKIMGLSISRKVLEHDFLNK